MVLPLEGVVYYGKDPQITTVMSRKITKEEAERLLKRYQNGQCTPEEMEIVRRWYQSYDDVEVPGLSDVVKQGAIKAAMRDNIYRNIERRSTSRDARESRSILRRLHLHEYAVLWPAAAVLVLSIAVGFYFYSDNPSRSKDASLATNVEDTQIKAQVLQSSAPVLYLPDGSVVWLKGDSRLEFPERFDATTREVRLIGEAFFDIARDVKKPFIIHSPSFTTRVLGTSFNIKDHEYQDLPEVAVVSGEVMVSLGHTDGGTTRQVVLRPNKKATYSRKEDVLVETPVDNGVVATVAKRKFLFEEARVADIIKVFNAEFDIDIQVSDETLNGCVITGDFSGLEMHVGLEALSKAINGEYSIDGRKVVVSGPGCDSNP